MFEEQGSGSAARSDWEAAQDWAEESDEESESCGSTSIDLGSMDGEGVEKVGLWGGVPGLPFMVWEQNVEYELKRIRARQGYKGVSAGMQLGHIRTRITPYTPGAMAHEAIEEALRPALLAAHTLPHPEPYQATKSSVQARTTSYLCLDVLRKG